MKTIMLAILHQIKCFIIFYAVGIAASFRQLFWKTRKNVTRLPVYNGKRFETVVKPLALITGGSKGIGFEVARLLIKEDFRVMLLARNVEDGLCAVKSLKKMDPKCLVTFHSVDISNKSQLRSFLKNEVLAKHSKLHLLINNAGVMMLPFMPASDGDYEMQWAVNLVSLLRITETLRPLVEKAALEDGLGRIINLSSSAQFAHEFSTEYFTNPMTVGKYSSHAAYANSKLAVALYTKYLQSQLPETVGAYCLHPGVIYTQLYQHTSYLNRKFLELAPVKALMRSAENAAWDVLFLCLEDPENMAGGWVYFENNVGTPFASVDEKTYDAFVDYCKKMAREFQI